jgi:hypothetical protein
VCSAGRRLHHTTQAAAHECGPLAGNLTPHCRGKQSHRFGAYPRPADRYVYSPLRHTACVLIRHYSADRHMQRADCGWACPGCRKRAIVVA